MSRVNTVFDCCGYKQKASFVTAGVTLANSACEFIVCFLCFVLLLYSWLCQISSVRSFFFPLLFTVFCSYLRVHLFCKLLTSFPLFYMFTAGWFENPLFLWRCFYFVALQQVSSQLRQTQTRFKLKATKRPWILPVKKSLQMTHCATARCHNLTRMTACQVFPPPRVWATCLTTRCLKVGGHELDFHVAW